MSALRDVGSTGQADQGTAVLIGAKFRAARRARRLSLAQLAEGSGLTKGYLSKLERDQANASVAALIRICETLGIRPGELFDGPSGTIVRHDSYPPINFGGKRMGEYLLTPQGEQRLQAILSEIRPSGGSGKEPYQLPADVEFVLVLEGELELTLGGETSTLSQGDAATFPAEVSHTFRNPSKARNARVLWVFSPALPTSNDEPS